MAQATKETKMAGTDRNPAGMVDAGLRSGQAHEMTLILPLKPGGAQKMRDRLKNSASENAQLSDKVATLHDLRFVPFDNDTRVIFATTYDGGFEQYIKDFSTIVPDMIDREFAYCEGYPGVRSPEIWDYIARHQVEAIVFYSTYPDVTVRQVWKGQRLLKAFEALLDEAQS
jgi:hypothetical protein